MIAYQDNSIMFAKSWLDLCKSGANYCLDDMPENAQNYINLALKICKTLDMPIPMWAIDQEEFKEKRKGAKKYVYYMDGEEIGVLKIKELLGLDPAFYFRYKKITVGKTIIKAHLVERRYYRRKKAYNKIT